MRYTIQPAHPDHLAALPAIESAAATLFPPTVFPPRLYGDTVSLDLLRGAQAEQRLWVALLEGGEPIGFIVMAEMDGDAYVRELDVHPDHGRQGIGTALMHTGMAWAKAQGYGAVVLSTFSTVAWNAPFYAKLGFDVIPRADRQPGMIQQHAEEADWGLDPDQRVGMRLRLVPEV